MVQDRPMGTRQVAAVVVGLVALPAAAVTVGTRAAGERWAALGLVVLGLLVGGVAAVLLRRPRAAGPRAPRRTTAERLNDIAFTVVVLAVWALALGQLGVWAGLVTGLLAGGALGLTLARDRAHPR
jgi:hypothetical protein